MEGLRRGGGSWGQVAGDKGMMGTAPGWWFHSPDRRHCVLGMEEMAGAQLAESPQGQVGAKCVPQISGRLWSSGLLTVGLCSPNRELAVLGVMCSKT